MAHVTKMAIVPHIDKPQVAEAVQQVVAWAGQRGVGLRMPREDATALGLPSLSCEGVEVREADVVVVLGGDGTMLRAARLIGGRAVPVLGVKLGKFGFLSEVGLEELKVALDQVVRGEYEIEERTMLTARISSGDREHEAPLALNEVVIERGAQQKLLELAVSINGQLFNTYACDGLILATPTGSTAYSLSAGGPIVKPTARLLLMTPVCPHGLFDRSLVLDSHDTVDVTCPNPAKRIATISVDGRSVLVQSTLAKLSVRAADSTFRLVKVTGRDFYSVLKEKLRVWDFFNR